MARTYKGIPARSIPRHVAIIMDGNGRWACKRGLPRIMGHERGIQSVRKVVRACRRIGIKYLTLYAFSTENWVRPKKEIDALMGLLVRFLRLNRRELDRNRIRLRISGRLADLPAHVRTEIDEAVDATRRNRGSTLIIALSYSGRSEMTDAVRRIAQDAKAGHIDPKKITERTIARNLYLPDVPDPDLLIRTSGEQRISNFLLWQVSYTELYFTRKMWPDFTGHDLVTAVREYANRHRRFGDIR